MPRPRYKQQITELDADGLRRLLVIASAAAPDVVAEILKQDQAEAEAAATECLKDFNPLEVWKAFKDRGVNMRWVVEQYISAAKDGDLTFKERTIALEKIEKMLTDVALAAPRALQNAQRVLDGDDKPQQPALPASADPIASKYGESHGNGNA